MTIQSGTYTVSGNLLVGPVYIVAKCLSLRQPRCGRVRYANARKETTTVKSTLDKVSSYLEIQL